MHTSFPWRKILGILFLLTTIAAVLGVILSKRRHPPALMTEETSEPERIEVAPTASPSPPPAAGSEAAETEPQTASNMAVTTWGPPEPKKRKPVGMGDVVLGFVYSQIFAALPILIVLPTALSNLSPSASYEESSNQLNSALTSGPVIVITMLLSWLGWMTAVWWAATRKGDGDWRTLLKWKFVPARDIPIGIGVAVAFRLYELGVSAILRALGVAPESLSNTSTITSQTGVILVLLALGAALGAPLVEEIFFRGLFLSVAVRNYGKWAGVIITSVVFGLMHFQPTLAGTLTVVGQTTLIGVVLALLVLKTGRLWTAICAHLAINISGVALALIFLS